ncbi:hypothetical protein [Ralstonia flaminis]|jgi:hypothetical protein|uniref:Uncharacterized protein n=1 Tax=Ralstonia flaminis TaxID=3058597 RepID=A0ABM9K2T1_9RALS|nr:hypothetical protein [Ralstonia sp. LMG 18101]CAJ0812911.1 hypothetical protein LMG18101_01730 [Ralstonia sp. LMG 18101]
MTQIVGGWTEFDYEITAEAKTVLKEAIGNLVGVQYTPTAFATQVVAGTNYAFLCTGTTTYITPHTQFPALVYVHKPLSGDAHLTEIRHIKP